MFRRILLLAIIAGTPVAESRAEFLFSSTELKVHADAGASTSRPERDPQPTPQFPGPLLTVERQPAGMDSNGPNTLTGGVSASALPAARVCVSTDDNLSSFARENTLRYQSPTYAGPFKPPREAC